jgi:xanthine dehydrogenase iron-sulfur cluster and FAD-binding subunit A
MSLYAEAIDEKENKSALIERSLLGHCCRCDAFVVSGRPL